MDAVAGMEKERWRAGAGKSGGNLASNQSGFSQPRHDDFAAAVTQQLNRAHETFIEPFDQRKKPVGLDPQHVCRAFENAG